MEDLKFQNQYHTDKEVTKEYAKYVFCKSTRILGIVLMIISAIAFVLSLKAGYKMSESALFILCFVGGLLIYGYYIIIVKVVDHSAKKKEQEQPECIVRFGNKILMEQGKLQKEYEYKQVRKFYNLPHIYALIIGKNQAVLVKKGGFTKGKEEEFEKFIKERML